MQRPRKGFSDRVARAMARYEAETGQRLLPGPDGKGGADGADRPARRQVPPYGQVVAPANHLQSANAGLVQPPTEAGVVTTAAFHPEAIDLLEQSRRRKMRRRVFLILICLLLIGLAFVPVSNYLVLPATIIAYGEEAIVVSPASGTLKQTLIEPGDKVKRGERLFLIETPPPVNLVAERRDWNALKIREARLVAQIAGHDSFSMPDGLFNLGMGLDPNSMLYEQRRIFEEGLREDRARFSLLEELAEGLEKDSADAKASKAAVEKQLAVTEARLRKAKALKDQNVVYDGGVYTKQLLGTLKQMSKTQRAQFAKHEKAADQAAADLAGARDALRQRKRQRANELAGELSWARSELARSSARLATMASQHLPVEVRSNWTGSVEEVVAPGNDGQVQSGEKLLALRVPSEKAVLEALVPAYDRQRIRVGQPASVTFPYPGNDRSVEYAGVVLSMAPSRGQLAYVEIEIDTPKEAGSVSHEFVEGLSGEVELETSDEPLRKHLWRWLGRQAELVDTRGLMETARTYVDRTVAALAPLLVRVPGSEEPEGMAP